ncbi:alpha/beta hydrolase [Paenibacillus sp. CF384]|uniref:alpha/beta hydrolase n=1 Tax=Paenibacillus sp. CF384 TaxID=1884382 RepID=UPI00089509E3|nr:alpha/beta hydrolase [Paenibacillus sp. CF384]SDW21321.1 Acetyl esterase/lipase [Paenibacillus sp. CF384]
MLEREIQIISDVIYGEADGKPLLLDIALPSQRGGKLPIAMYIHGGAWLWGDKAEPSESGMFVRHFAAQGYLSVSINYRFSNEAIYPAQLHDAKAAVRWLRANAESFGGDPARIGVFGHSAGGHLAALLGTTGHVEEMEGCSGNPGISSSVQAVATWSAPVDFLQMLDGFHDSPESLESRLIGGYVREHQERAKLASPLTFVTDAAPPFLIIHGTEDEIIPFNQAEILHEALHNSSILAIKGANHGLQGGNLGWEDVLQMTEIFFNRHIRS